MRIPFREARVAMIAANYQCHPQYEVDIHTTESSVVFGGKAICLVYFKGGSWYDNGGRNYSPASMELCPRDDRQPKYRLALEMGGADHITLVQLLNKIPRSDRQASEMLVLADELDTHVALYLERAKEISDSAEVARNSEMNKGWRREQLKKDLLTEVIRLYQEGLLDNISDLKGLRDIAQEINS